MQARAMSPDRAEIGICAMPERRNHLTPYDFESLKRRPGLALQHVTVSLSLAVCRKRRSRQRPGGRQDLHLIRIHGANKTARLFQNSTNTMTGSSYYVYHVPNKTDCVM